MDQEITERTSLTSGHPKPRYAFESSIIKQRNRRVKQFQCCICAIFLGIITTAIVISIICSVNHYEVNNSTETNVTFLNLNVALSERSVSSVEYKEALEAGKKALETREELEKTTPSLDKTSPSYKHQKVVATSSKGRSLSRLGYAEEHATKFYNKDKLNVSEVCYEGKVDEIFSEVCNKTKLICDQYQKYRSYDGSCNNLEFPDKFGVAYTPFIRLLPPDYADGISAPRVGHAGEPLPSARTISLVVHRPIYKDDPKFTVMLAVFGQFLDHDITATALNQGVNGSSISCCNSSVKQQHPECFPVNLDKTDSYYQNYNVTCMEFVRSAATPTCCFGPRQQLNQASAYIDGSVIYSSDENIAKKLRSLKNGELKMYITEDLRSLLPVSDDPYDGCNRVDENKKGRYCFATGDARANENLHLTSMHLLWARQHNFIAKNLIKTNPKWEDEKVFQEARRIVGAQLQHIAYKEFLPILLGDRLKVLDEGYFEGYNISVDPSIANVFATSAFRFAHTLIPSLMKMIGNDSSSPEYVALHKMLFNPFGLYNKGEMDRALKGAIETNIQASDPYFTPELKQHMFEQSVLDRVDSAKLCGLDLVSLNIQRGRDHGLAGYTSWREHCALKRPRTFNQLTGDIDDDSLNYIQSVYRHVDDIDLYTGSLSEKPLENNFLGPTITCLLQNQFARLKTADRFWYESNGPTAFTPSQLTEIRKTTLARIICDNSDNVQYLQPEVMKRTDRTNRVVNCEEIKKIDWKHWKEIRVPLADKGMKIKKM